MRSVFFWFWLDSCYTCSRAASQQHNKIFFLATSTLLQVAVAVSVLKMQVPVLCMQVQVPSTTRLQSQWNTHILTPHSSETP